MAPHHHRAHLAALLTAGLLSAALPAGAAARPDDDVFPGDPQDTFTTFAADGSVSTRTANLGSGAFVRELLAAGALGGSEESDMVCDGTEACTTTPAEVPDTEHVPGTMRSLSRVGYAAPDGPRAKRYARMTRAQARRAMTIRLTRLADGTPVREQAYAVDTTSGKVRKVGLDDARRLSADPRTGTPGTEYVYQVSINLPGDR